MSRETRVWGQHLASASGGPLLARGRPIAPRLDHPFGLLVCRGLKAVIEENTYEVMKEGNSDTAASCLQQAVCVRCIKKKTEGNEVSRRLQDTPIEKLQQLGDRVNLETARRAHEKKSHAMAPARPRL